MNCLDSTFWIEYFVDGPQAGIVDALLKKPDKIILPSICLYEVGRYLTRVYGAAAADEDIKAMEQAVVIPLEGALAVQAAREGLKHRLAMADSIVYTCARAWDATLWTLDGDFKELEGVKYFPKKSK